MVCGGRYSLSSAKSVSGEATPVLSAVLVVISLNVEPGMYRSWYAFARSGLRLSANSFSSCFVASLELCVAIKFGSYVGHEYIARIAPERGSIITIEPSRLPSNLAASR
uniref:Unannotated protein n=1 Tax=freshwater metagenome TaxID=449393 RepID=A0A6J7MTI6_9ZZZZ